MGIGPAELLVILILGSIPAIFAVIDILRSEFTGNNKLALSPGVAHISQRRHEPAWGFIKYEHSGLVSEESKLLASPSLPARQKSYEREGVGW